jgi:hypothetical protein
VEIGIRVRDVSNTRVPYDSTHHREHRIAEEVAELVKSLDRLYLRFPTKA